ncbi:MAG: LysR family transcriptional regulator [Negativicutes bacterium]
MELRQLQYFQSVGRLLSITKTADKFNIAQPSVTIAIQSLEKELGVQLLDRSHRRIAFTAEGQIFLQKVDEILSLLSDSVRQMTDCSTRDHGYIRMGITPTTSSVLFPRIFTEFHAQYSHIHLTSVEEGSFAIVNLLEQGELDIGIIIISDLASDLEILPLATEQVVLCLPTDHPLINRKNITFKILKDYPFLLFKEDTYLRQIILQECKKNQITPNIAFSSSQIETIIGLVQEDAGITFLLEATVRKYANMVGRRLTNPLSVQMGLAWNKDKYLSKAARAFIDFVAERQKTASYETPR